MAKFKDLLFRAGFMNFGKLDKSAAKEFLQINSDRTLQRWLNDKSPCPRAIKMLEQRIEGSVSKHKDWNGFFICRDGYLWTPSGKRYQADYINKIDFLQRSVRYNESHVQSLQNQIAHLHEIVGASETLKAMGTDLINMSNQLAIKDVILKYGDKKTS